MEIENSGSFDVDPSFNGDEPINGGGEAPKVAAVEKPAEAPAPAPVVDDWKTREFEYPAMGKTVKEPLEMILKRASQGYDYAQKMGEFNNAQKSLTEYQEKLKQFEYLKEVDDHCKANPEWANLLKDQWEKRSAISQNIDPNDPMFNFFQNQMKQFGEKFDKISGELESHKSEKQKEVMAQEDQALDAEINGIRTQYANLPWDSLDEFGRNLEAKVVEHAAKNGIRNFKTAFRDLYHDEIVKIEKDKAKEELANERNEQRKKGFIGETSTPTLTVKTRSVRDKSYDDLAREAKQELRI